MEPVTVAAIGLGLYAWLSGDDEEDKDEKADVPDRTEKDEEEVPDEGESQAVKVAALIIDPIRHRSFYQIYKNGPNAVTIAGQLLAKVGINNGQNRRRLIRCWTQLKWNADRYASTRTAETWGTAYDVNGRNLSAAWLPRNASAAVMLAQGMRPPRTIAADGSYEGDGTAYGLLWIGSIRVVKGEFFCDPDDQPPEWLLESIEGT